jgi:hypothetical protein
MTAVIAGLSRAWRLQTQLNCEVTMNVHVTLTAF